VTAQTGVFSLLSADGELAALMEIPVDQLLDRVIRTGHTDIPNVCLVVRWESPTLDGLVGLQQFTLRAHERSESYARIDALLDRAKVILTSVVHQYGITQIDWRGRSPDLVDDGYRTLTRYDTYFVAAGLRTREEV
jgi:hypothetical protein